MELLLRKILPLILLVTGSQSYADFIVINPSIVLGQQACLSINEYIDSLSKGEIEKASRGIQNTLLSDQQTLTNIQRLTAALYLSESFEYAGQYLDALKVLNDYYVLAKKAGSPEILLEFNMRTARYHITLSQYSEAENRYLEALENSQNTQTQKYSALVLYALGELHFNFLSRDDAGNYFDQAISSAEKQRTDDLLLRSYIKRGLLYVDSENQQELVRLLSAIKRKFSAVKKLSTNRKLGVEVVDVYLYGLESGVLSGQYLTEAFGFLQPSLTSRNDEQDLPLLSEILGKTGRLYELAGRFKESKTYTEQALLVAQRYQRPDLVYRWEWQLGRILFRLNNVNEAYSAYKEALNTLNEIRIGIILESKNSYAKNVSPLYSEYANILLTKAVTVTSEEQKAELLNELLNVLEESKLAEIEDYFRNDCTIAATKTFEFNYIPANSAVIYPLILEDKLELLVASHSGVYHFRSKVDKRKLIDTILELRTAIEQTRKSIDHTKSAKMLYEWIIAPISSLLKTENVESLIFVPDGPLRSIPMSVLFDGNKYLIERFSVSITPSLKLTSTTKIKRENISVFAGGLTESVQDFIELPGVGVELENIDKLFHGKILKDSEFTTVHLSDEVSKGGYSIVHIATHGQFEDDYLKSFLLTHDGKLTLNMLENTVGLRQFSNDPLELLVLSACQTAAGDDRAALGLAGIALKAGARSALATLWFINDEATQSLVTTFYETIKQKDVTKTHALRVAQLSLLNNSNTRHPSYWAPFVLVGNWL